MDYLIQKWKTGIGHEGTLYLMILGAAPIKECIDYAIEFEDFGDPDLSDFGFHYLDDRGNYTPMSWEDYDSWLERQKVIDGPYL